MTVAKLKEMLNKFFSTIKDALFKPMKQTQPQTISTAEMTKELVLSKCNYFVDVHVWPIKNSLNPERWLSNFRADEMEHAVQLLNYFIFFSEELVNNMFIASFQMISNQIRRKGDSFVGAKIAWNSFIDSVIVTPIRGEMPNISDSGFSFARKARQLVGIKEGQLMDHEQCLRLLTNKGPRPVFFVDDFVGSGDQFLKTWKRVIKLDRSTLITFKDYATVRGSRFYYCPLLCTEAGYQRIRNECPDVILQPVHILPAKYSALAPDSIIWPDHLKLKAEAFILGASKRAGIPDNHGGVDDWRGYNKLGLTIAFSHSVPDATLPLFYWKRNGWKPLIERA